MPWGIPLLPMIVRIDFFIYFLYKRLTYSIMIAAAMNMMMQQMISKGQLPPNMTAQQQVC